MGFEVHVTETYYLLFPVQACSLKINDWKIELFTCLKTKMRLEHPHFSQGNTLTHSDFPAIVHVSFQVR